jgi:hypothetical protein
VPVGSTKPYCERDALSVDHNMPLRPWFAFIRRIQSGFRAPLSAGTLALSGLALDQSIRSAPPSRSNKAWCGLAHTPACRRSPSLPRQVTP